MKYKVLLKVLQVLIHVKRFFWWLGSKSLFVLAKIFGPFWRLAGYLYYRANFLLRRIANATGINSQFLKRDNLQVIVFLILFFIVMPQTRLFASRAAVLPGQNTIAYALTGPDEEFSIEEVTAENLYNKSVIPSWKQGALSGKRLAGAAAAWQINELAGVMAGGSALSKPIIFPGASMTGGRNKTIEYMVEPGDSLGEIASQFGVSVATILWENKLRLTSLIRPGDKLKILPVTGLTHTVKRGDKLQNVAALYEAKTEDVIRFNKLKEDGTDLVAGETIIIPNGIKPQERAVASIPRSYSSFTRAAVPPGSRQSPSMSGFIWPTAARAITQYFSWRHAGLDIAGSWQSANYAAKAGTVEKAQCGWNSGYGCVIIINHGGGVKTLYGHNSKLLVFPGDHVATGQTIGLMGNTGKVRGRTGIHLHFEIQINGARVNPLGYVR